MKITIPGILIFLALVVAFFAWFGGPPTLSDYPSMRFGAGRTWYYCGILFMTGAGTACFGDKEYGMFPPTSLRWLYITVGILIMVIGAAWMDSLKKSWAPISPPAAQIDLGASLGSFQDLKLPV